MHSQASLPPLFYPLENPKSLRKYTPIQARCLLQVGNLISIVVVTFLMFVGCASTTNSANTDHRVCYWGGTDFNEKTKKLPISPQQSGKIAQSAFYKLSQNGITEGGSFDPEKPILYNGWYFFSLNMRHESVSLQGFYVNGQTGEVEFRYSDKKLNFWKKDIKDSDFSKIVKMKLD